MSIYLGTEKKDSGYPLTTQITSGSTNSQVPSAKAVYDIIGDVESILQTLNSGNGVA